MLVIRSLAFNVLFYLNLALCLLAAMVTMVLPPRFLLKVAYWWAVSTFWLMKVVVGTRYEVTGREHIPEGGIIVACKHQSAWETFALLSIFRNPVFILKRELTWIPFFGWCLLKTKMIPVDRGARSRALLEVTRRARVELGQKGRQLLIFPEGTRRQPGAEPAYKFGVTHLYSDLNVPCLPIALNSGLFWPRRSFLRRPGTIRLEIMPPIPAGVPKKEFHALLESRIETASNRLLAEGLDELARLGVEPPVGVARPQV